MKSDCGGVWGDRDAFEPTKPLRGSGRCHQPMLPIALRSNLLAIVSVVLYRRTIIEGVGVMKQMIRSAATAAAILVSGLLGTAAPAQAYPVDCAILLCLAGGWPTSAPCTHARTVFIRRITPWPIEPPLQIWRCPMGASFSSPAAPSPREPRKHVEPNQTIRFHIN